MSEQDRGPALPDAFGLRIPPSWQELDLRPQTRDAAARRTVDRRIGGVPELRAHRADLVRFLRTTAARAWDAGARYCAVFSEPAGDGVVPGAITVALLPNAPAEPGEPMVDAIVDQLQRSPAPPGGDTWLTTTTTELPEIGPAVQVFGVQDVDLDDTGYQVRVVQMHTFVPVDAGVLLVAATSPAVDLADSLLELFSTVTGSLSLHTLGEADG